MHTTCLHDRRTKEDGQCWTRWCSFELKSCVNSYVINHVIGSTTLGWFSCFNYIEPFYLFKNLCSGDKSNCRHGYFGSTLQFFYGQLVGWGVRIVWRCSLNGLNLIYIHFVADFFDAYCWTCFMSCNLIF